MTVTKGAARSLFVVLASGLAGVAGHAAGSSAAGPRLTAISSHLHGRGASLVIEATAPVPYVATHPDPLTLLVDFRNVGAEGLAATANAAARGPIANITVEATESMGVPASRVRIALAQAVDYRVRSERNTIVVDFDKAKRVGLAGSGRRGGSFDPAPPRANCIP